MKRMGLFGVVVILAVLVGCTTQLRYRLSVPEGAFNVITKVPDKNQYGIVFDIKAPTSSYAGFEFLKKQIIQKHFAECKKSAITTWQTLPAGDGNATWLVEMFSNGGKEFAAIKVVQHGDADGLAIQSYSVSFQRAVMPNAKNIDEFCG